MNFKSEDILRIEYREYQLRSESILSNSIKFEHLYLYNDSSIFYPSISSIDNIPQGGVYFDEIEDLYKFKNLKSLFFDGVFIKHLPKNFSELNALTDLKLLLSKENNHEKTIAILLELKSLKWLDLTGSIITEEQFNIYREALKKNKVVVKSTYFLNEN
jgi:Leucine-rich repeat (LRR) protein